MTPDHPTAREEKRPRRAFDYEIVVSADTHKDALYALREIADRIGMNPYYGGVLGGPSMGWAVTPSGDGKKTHEQYIDELNAYLARLDAKEKTP